MAVLIGVTEPQDSALGKLHPARALDLQEKRLDRIVDPDQLLAGERRVSRFDVRARPIGNDAPAFEAPAHPFVLELWEELAQLDDEQIVGGCVQRITIAFAGLPAALQQRFVIARYATRVASVGAGKLVWGKMHFEKRAHLGVVAGIDGWRGFAACTPDRRSG